MTDSARPLCDCPEPCGCYAEGYAAGKDKACFEVIASLWELMALIARSSPGSFSWWRHGRWRTMTTASETETGSRAKPALVPTLPEGAPTTPADVDVLADAPS